MHEGIVGAKPNQLIIASDKIFGDTLTMKSAIVKRSVIIDGHKTSVSLEDAFWSTLKEIAHAQGATVSQTVTEIDKSRQRGTLSCAIRLFILDQVRSKPVAARVAE
jgi:predicted DNA-binding ribbon-helix-helix protein